MIFIEGFVIVCIKIGLFGGEWVRLRYKSFGCFGIVYGFFYFVVNIVGNVVVYFLV